MIPRHALPVTLLLAAGISVGSLPSHAADTAATDTEPSPSPTPSADDEKKPETFANPLVDNEAQTLLPTRTKRTVAESAASITLVPRYLIQSKQAFDLTDAVRLAPSLSLAQSGTRNKLTSIFLRGSNSNHTLVMIDGVRANKPSDGRFDFDTIPVEDIERIEVLRGPQSALYGSDALGGVINIVTRPGSGPLRTGSRLEFGNYGINRQSITANGEVGKTGLSFTATRLSSSGLFPNDDSRVLSTSLRLDRALSANTGLTFIGRVNDAEVGTPGQRDLFYDPNARSFPRDLFGSLQLTNTSGRRRDRVVFGVIDRKLRLIDPVNPDPGPFPTSVDQDLRDRILTLEGQSSFDFGRHTFTAGGEMRRESSVIDQKASYGDAQFSGSTTTRALFAQDEYRSGKLTLVPGLRLENNSQFGNDVNGRLAAAYDLSPRTKLKGSIGTAFRAPSMYELYYPQSGDPNLKPEESTGYEVGMERGLSRDGRVEVTLFRNRFRNLIGTVPTEVSPQYPFGFKAGNVDQATTQGLEIALRQPIGKSLTAVVNHAFLGTESSSTPLLRRPSFITTADLLYQRGRMSYDLGLIAQGRRYDANFVNEFEGRRYGGYARVDLSVGYAVAPNAQFYVRLQNLFNRDYEEVAGYPAPGLNFVAGFQTRAF